MSIFTFLQLWHAPCHTTCGLINFSSTCNTFFIYNSQEFQCQTVFPKYLTPCFDLLNGKLHHFYIYKLLIFPTLLESKFHTPSFINNWHFRRKNLLRNKCQFTLSNCKIVLYKACISYFTVQISFFFISPFIKGKQGHFCSYLIFLTTWKHPKHQIFWTWPAAINILFKLETYSSKNTPQNRWGSRYWALNREIIVGSTKIPRKFISNC